MFLSHCEQSYPNVNGTSKHPGQTHLNSDTKIADEGRPQGAPLPIVFSRRYALGRAPTRGAPTNSLLGRAPTRGATIVFAMPWGGRQGAPLIAAFGPGEGTHKGRPSDSALCLAGVLCLLSALWPVEGAHKGRPYRLFSRRYALGRAPTRALPRLLSAFGPGKGTHKGRYQLPSLGVMPWGGHPQGAPLPIVFSRRYALGRAPTRGAPTNCLLSALCPGEGAHKGRPYRLSFLGVMAGGRAPTRGAPTYCLLSALCPGEGAHKGRPYLLSSPGVMPWGGHPQGAPLPIVFSRRYALGRAPTRGAPTNCLLSALCPGKGTHKGRPYLLSSLGAMTWGGHPQGAPLPIAFSRRYALGRAPTRGAPTRFRQPHVVLSQFDAIALGKHQGIGVSEKHLRSPHSGWLFCLVAN